MIVGLLANAGSGKDTAADYLVKEHGFVKTAFADPVKNICKDLFDFSDEQLWGPSEYRNKPDLRYLRITYDDYIYNSATSSSLGLTNDDVNYLTNTKQDLYLTPRHALQQLGTEFGRSCYKNVWVSYTERKILELQKNGVKNIVISDVRFFNEVEMLKKYAKIIKIVRPNNNSINTFHKSEQEQNTISESLIDHTIYNNDTLEGFYKKIVHVLNTKR